MRGTRAPHCPWGRVAGRAATGGLSAPAARRGGTLIPHIACMRHGAGFAALPARGRSGGATARSAICGQSHKRLLTCLTSLWHRPGLAPLAGLANQHAQSSAVPPSRGHQQGGAVTTGWARPLQTAGIARAGAGAGSNASVACASAPAKRRTRMARHATLLQAQACDAPVRRAGPLRRAPAPCAGCCAHPPLHPPARRQDADRLTKAFDDPEFRRIFNEYAQEISDPKVGAARMRMRGVRPATAPPRSRAGARRPHGAPPSLPAPLPLSPRVPGARRE